jgi:V8-like Glu-specific endopeptidase
MSVAPVITLEITMNRKSWTLLCIGASCIATAAHAQSPYELDQPQRDQAQLNAQASAASAYWTAERMRKAKPMPMPSRVVRASELTATSGIDEILAAGAEPGYATGCKPPADNCQSKEHAISPNSPLYDAAIGLAQPQHGTKPANPRNGPYGPFQRWSEHDPITTYPKSTIGKLFFTLPGVGNFVCSASVINRNTVITAGHCNSNGAGTFATNRLFCPNWKDGQNPARGCWSVLNSKTSAGWHNAGDPDRDYACLITNTVGTKVANSIGNVTGWLGRAWNFSASQAERTFGYPQAAPFNGNRLITTASTEWYTHDFTAGGQVSKVIGSDLTGGSSGGPWILGWAGAEFADSDANSATDPGSNWVNGVNSHKRCAGNCNTPPTTTTGVFWQEMTSPPFMNTAAVDESEDVVQVCFNAGGA